MNKSTEPTKNKINPITEGSLFKGILLFSIPLMFSQVLQVLFNTADVAVVGKFSGSATALGAVGSTTILVSLFTGILIGISSGINVFVARFAGAKDDDKIKKTIDSSFIISVISGVLLFVVCFFLARPLLLLIKTKEAFLDGAVRYFRIYSIGLPGLAIFNFGNGVLSAVGDTKRPLIYLTAGGLINLGLNLFFVIVCGMEVEGVATASIISQYVSAILITVRLLMVKDSTRLSLKGLKPDKELSALVLKIGIPAAIQNTIFAVANLFIQVGVNSLDEVMISGNSAAANFDALIYNVLAAFFTACTSYMGQNRGAGKMDRVMKSYLICLLYSFIVGLILGLSLVFFGREFLLIFTNDEAVIDAGMKRINIMGYSYAFSVFMDCAISASRGLGKSFVPSIIVIIGSCVFRIAWIYTVFAYFKTIPSLYLLYIFSWTITAIAETIYFIYAYKKEKKLMEVNPRVIKEG